MFSNRPPGARHFERGDIDSNDFEVGDLTKDGVWRDLDLSSIIPVNTKLVILKVMGVTSNNSGSVLFKTKGYSNIINRAGLEIVTVNKQYRCEIALRPSAAGLLQYYVLSSATYTSIDIAVLSWFK